MNHKIFIFLDSIINKLRTFPVLNRLPVNFFRFVFVGGSGFIIDFFIFNILYYVVGFRGSITIAQITPTFTFAISLTNIAAVAMGSLYGFILNKNWSFTDKNDNVASQYGKYLLVAICNNLLNNFIFGGVLYGVFNDLQRTQFLFTAGAKMLATSFQVFTSYLLYKYVVFRQDKEVISEALVP